LTDNDLLVQRQWLLLAPAVPEMVCSDHEASRKVTTMFSAFRPYRVAAVAVAAWVSLLGAAAGTAGVLPGRHATQDASDQARMRQHNIALVTTALQVVFTEHRIDQIDRYFSPDFVQHSPLVTDPGRDGLKQWLARTVAAIPDLTYTSNQVLADGDRVITFSTVTGTIVNDMPEYGIKANGQKLTVLTAHIFRVAGNQIVEHWEVVDTGPLVKIALGVG
jgi:predicted SnoaL-like aldol condensation-catalyzing enzyme